MINMTTLIWKYKIYNFRWKEKKDVHTLSTWGDVKDPDVKSRFNEETKSKPNMIIDYNKSMDGVDKLHQFITMWLVTNSGDIFFILILIFLLLILLFVSKNQNRSMHAILYYLIKMTYYMPLLTLTPIPYPFLFQL